MGQGVNESEKYLKSLCDKTFLSLWSHANVYRQPGSELCDLLVVVGDDIVIFSDKHCAYGTSVDAGLNWKRWFKKAVLASAKQLWGAESWIKRDPNRVFIDAQCIKKFPLPILLNEKTKFHLVLVAHGSSRACVDAMGGSGSHIIYTKLKSVEDHSEPFYIGDISGNKTFLHILDDFSLELLLENLSTVTDFVAYLRKREVLMKETFITMALGEEELLADYLTNLDDEDEHDFDYPAERHSKVIRLFDEGEWQNFQGNQRRVNQLRANESSKFWDALIEEFSLHAISETQHYVSSGGFLDAERAIRFMAMESRFARRYLSNALLDMFSKVPENMRMLRVVQPQKANSEIIYVFALFPYYNPMKDSSYNDYRTVRREFLENSIQVAKLRFDSAKYIIGIGMESGDDFTNKSKDLIALDCSNWKEEFRNEALRVQKEYGILTRPISFEFNDIEYPTR
ncbi:hypothetical protein [Dyadobacter diqingensis]|uniref:hypothetical protein n=1 Tax=Dyadobacter diqingensis TaxID=2938121 RepID=UPI0020C19363|nr:hypothetical protein [Dyadobacter diqingensis]